MINLLCKMFLGFYLGQLIRDYNQVIISSQSISSIATVLAEKGFFGILMSFPKNSYKNIKIEIKTYILYS